MNLTDLERRAEMLCSLLPAAGGAAPTHNTRSGTANATIELVSALMKYLHDQERRIQALESRR